MKTALFTTLAGFKRWAPLLLGRGVLFLFHLFCPPSQLLNAMVAKLGNREDPLPQDAFEGVDEDEWD